MFVAPLLMQMEQPLRQNIKDKEEQHAVTEMLVAFGTFTSFNSRGTAHRPTANMTANEI